MRTASAAKFALHVVTFEYFRSEVHHEFAPKHWIRQERVSFVFLQQARGMLRNYCFVS
ncbi:hypothetical protein FM101_10300 [Arthrobacter rhombi]|uniref:Uncharacterized protein n=1 Tax=Arthrobacter rhombi TaxID=71253 RepID=A0A1R4GG73_9MICC|nr:hypothetical protein FM101_10300 [Arthrobacter rhombi]